VLVVFIISRHTLEYKSVQIVGCADNINLMGRSLTSVEEILEALEMEGKEVGLKINEQETKVLIQSKERIYPEWRIVSGMLTWRWLITLPTWVLISQATMKSWKNYREQETKVLIQSKERRYPEWEISIRNVNLEVANNFAYLGTHFTSNNEELEEIQSRIHVANRTYFSILPLIKSHGIGCRVQVTLYKTLIRSILMYDSEVWTLSQGAANKIDLFERKILRKIFGPTQSKGVWRIRYNCTMMRSITCKRMWPFQHAYA
jgi:hypothetical protein